MHDQPAPTEDEQEQAGERLEEELAKSAQGFERDDTNRDGDDEEDGEQ